VGQKFRWGLVQQTEVTARAMPMFASSVEVVKAELGEAVVVIGTLCL
jgi:hypothetical protein